MLDKKCTINAGETLTYSQLNSAMGNRHHSTFSGFFSLLTPGVPSPDRFFICEYEVVTPFSTGKIKMQGHGKDSNKKLHWCNLHYHADSGAAFFKFTISKSINCEKLLITASFHIKSSGPCIYKNKMNVMRHHEVRTSVTKVLGLRLDNSN